MSFHDKTAKEGLNELATSENGLTSYEADRRLRLYGKNILETQNNFQFLALVGRQFTSPIVWVLLAAMGVSILVGEIIDFWVIGAIVILNSVLGVVQEYRAEKAIQALRQMTALKAIVLRDGRKLSIHASELVPGDIIFLETGDKVPADARLLDIVNFQIQEAALTGESTPVIKKTDIVKSGTILADRLNLAFSSTIVTAGRAKAVVIATGHKTEIGKIATLIQQSETETTPLQHQIAKLSSWITLIVIAIAAIVFLTGALQGQPLAALLLAAIALAVAAIPEGLPAVVTVSLSLGVQRMAARNALIRKLPSAETLGSCTVICSDKTGTLTHNEMTVRKLFVDDTIVDVTGSGHSTQGTFSSSPPDMSLLLTIGLLNNNSTLTEKAFGDPTEIALIVSARKSGLFDEKLKSSLPRVGELEFTSERKRMTTFHRKGTKTLAFVKGAPDVILERCTTMLLNGKAVPLNPARKKKILETTHAFGKQALRVLGFAMRETTEHSEDKLTFVGLQAMIDPPRDEAKEAIAQCHSAGIKVVMITGDHLTTAETIARELGIVGRAITGESLDKLDLDAHVNDIGVYARVNPEHKLRIVKALQKHGHVVAMTGDGVNDAPALKKADIGIAMGSGTDVSKEASVMVLADDNFASIVFAIKEGRRIYDNLKRFVTYLSCNMGAVLTIFAALVLNLPLPVLALQLLWMNLITDGLPALALGVDPLDKNAMNKPPRNNKKPLITFNGGVRILALAITMATGSLLLFSQYPLDKGRTVVFSVLVLFQLFNVFNQRDSFKGIWIWLALLSSLALQIIAVHLLPTIFKTVPLNLVDWLLVIGVAATILVVGHILRPLKNGD